MPHARPTARPNVLLIMTDEERYPPPYEEDGVARFRRDHLPARQRLRAAGVELHRHYAASTACLPSRASLFTGHYPSLHGVVSTDGLAKAADDPAMSWLDPDGVPTMGDWFRAAGYRTHYRGKWHVSHADLVPVGDHAGLVANDRQGRVVDEVVELYRRADRLDPFGFSGWIGPEPHGPDPANTGYVRDPLLADQVRELLATLAADGADDRPWLAVASFVNPHDIAFSGFGWGAFGFPAIGSSVPDVAEAPSQADGFGGRPSCHQQFRDLWPRLLYPQPADNAYRRFYLWLHQLVDRAIEQVLEALDSAGLTDNTIVVFTSDHGDMVGAHGGMQQKWHVAYDEATRVPLLVSGPGITPAGAGGGLHIPTSHVDLLPTLLGLVGIDPESLAGAVAEHHIEAQGLVGRDLSPVITGADPSAVDAPVYFTTEDQISRGLRDRNPFTGEAFTPVEAPAKIESVITRLGGGGDGGLPGALGDGGGAGGSGSSSGTSGGEPHLWKLNHYYDRLAEWEAEHGVGGPPPAGQPAAGPVGGPGEDQWELYDLTADPQERVNLAGVPGVPGVPVDRLRAVLESAREHHRRVPTHRNRTH